MPELIIKIKDKIAKPLNNCVICDNSDYTVKFIFDEEWEKEPLRIARFIWNKQYVDVQFTGDTCEVPVVSKTNNLAIGVYAGDLRTTTPAILTCYTSILSEDVVEHSVTPSEYEEIMKLLNAQATDIAALKAVDKRIWTNLDTINKTASAAKIKAEEGVAKADNALTATRTNATNITNLQTDVTDLTNEKNIMGSRLTEAETTLNNVKTTAETAETKADNALARNIFTDEEKAKLANITNPIIIKGRVDTVQDLPTEAKIGWFYFVGLESASSYEEYCYSEKGWEYIGLSKEGVDLSNYYTKEQVDTTVNALKAADTSLGTRIDNVDSKASAAKVKAEEGVAKADNALAAAGTNATNINSLQTDVTALNTDVNALKAVDENIWTNLDTINKTASAAKTKAEEGVAKADDALAATRTNATDIDALETNVNALKAVDTSLGTRIDSVDTKASTAKTKAEEGVAKADNALTATRTNANKINAHANDIAINRTTLGYQCKNLLKNTAVTKTVSGITFTVNSDKSVTVNGTATAVAQLTVGTIVKDGNYMLTGCPSGGSASTYMLSLAYHKVGGGITYADENGSGLSVVFDSEKYIRINVRVQINKGVTVSNITFYPMLKDVDITDSTYEPYQPSLIDRCLLKDTSGEWLGHTQNSSITIDNLSAYTVLWINVSGAVAGINFQTNLIVPVAYLAKNTSNSVQLAGGIPSSAYIASGGPLAAKDMNGTITAKVSGNTLDLTISNGTIGSVEVISLM